MAVIAGVSELVAVFCSIMPFECCLMALAADMALFALQQPVIITGMRGMAGYAAIILIADQVVVG